MRESGGGIPSRFSERQMNMNTNNKKDVQSAIAIILFAMVFYAFSFKIQATTSDVLGSRFFPQAAAVCLVLLGVIQIFRNLRSKEVLTEEQEAKIAKTDQINRPLVLTTVMLFAYYFLCMGIGFTLTSMVYLVCSSLVLMPADSKKDKKTLLLVLLVAVLVPVFLNTVFFKVFHIMLPKGKLF